MSKKGKYLGKREIFHILTYQKYSKGQAYQF